MSSIFSGESVSLLYAYTYVLVGITLIVISYHVAKQVPLLRPYNDLLHKIYLNLARISIIITTLEKKLKDQEKDKITTSRYFNDSKYDFLNDLETIKNFVNIIFDTIIKDIEHFQATTMTNIDRIGAELKLTDDICLTQRGDDDVNDKIESQMNLASDGFGESKTDSSEPVGTTRNESNFEKTRNSSHWSTDEQELTKTIVLASLYGSGKDSKEKEQDKNQTEAKEQEQEQKLQVTSYVSKEFAKYTLNNSKAFGQFIETLLEIRKLLFMVVSHFFDMASDIAVAWNWYLLWQIQADENPDYLKNTNMGALFACCISVMFYYRIATAYKIYKLTKSKFDSILQFFLDFYILKLIYVNIVKMHSYKPLNILLIYREVEGSHESAYQAILTMVFLIQTNFVGLSSITSYISLGFSLWSLSSRFITSDKYFIDEKAQSIGIKLSDVKENGIFNSICNKFNIWWIYHILFRSFEVSFSVLLLALFWVIAGGLVFSIVMVVFIAAAFISNGCWYCQSLDVKQFDWWLFLSKLQLYTDFLKSFLAVSVFWIVNKFHHDDRPLAKAVSTWLFFLRLFIVCLFLVLIFGFNYGNYNTNVLVWFCFCFQFVLIIMTAIAIKKYVLIDGKATNFLNDGLDVVSHWRRGDVTNLLFMKQLNVNIFDGDKRIIVEGIMRVIANSPRGLGGETYRMVDDWYKTQRKSNVQIREDSLMNYLKRKEYTIVRRLAKVALDSPIDGDTHYLYQIALDIGIDLSEKLIISAERRALPTSAVTILHISCRNLQLEDVKWILKNEFVDNINSVVTKYNETALHYTVKHRWKWQNRKYTYLAIEICKLLIQHDIDTSIINYESKTAKDYLIEFGRDDVVQQLGI